MILLVTTFKGGYLSKVLLVLALDEVIEIVIFGCMQGLGVLSVVPAGY